MTSPAHVDLGRHRQVIIGSAGTVKLAGDGVMRRHAAITAVKEGAGEVHALLRAVQGPVFVERRGRRQAVTTPRRLADGDVGWGLIDGPAIGRAVMRGVRGPDQEAGIILDWSWSSFSDEQCLLSVLLHEFGHVLGLGHQDDAASIMFPATRCRPELSDADIAAVRFLYP